jgi:hypothetical protein
MVVAVAGLIAAVFLYLGWVEVISPLIADAPTGSPGPDAPATPLALSWPPPMAPPPSDLPSNPPPAAAPASAPAPVAPSLASPPAGPSQIPHRITRKTSRVMRRVFNSQLTSGLSGLRAHLEKCPGRSAQGGFGGNGTYLPGVEEMTLLMLEVEMLDGGVRIVDAPLAIPGSTSDAFAACVQQTLRGQVIAVPVAVAGERARIAFPLDPVSLAER